MTIAVNAAPHVPGAREAERARALREAARDLEAVFVEQMFKAMRETVPDGGLVSGGSGEEVFNALLDQHLAGEAPAQRDSEITEAVYRQLRNRAGIQDPAAELQAARQPIPTPPGIRNR